jgi:hypothetical protein
VLAARLEPARHGYHNANVPLSHERGIGAHNRRLTGVATWKPSGVAPQRPVELSNSLMEFMPAYNLHGMRFLRMTARFARTTLATDEACKASGYTGKATPAPQGVRP